VIFEDQTKGRVRLSIDGIVKANLEVDVDSEFHRAREREEVDRQLIGKNAD